MVAEMSAEQFCYWLAIREIDIEAEKNPNAWQPQGDGDDFIDFLDSIK